MGTNQRKNEKENLRFACSAFYSHKWQLDILFCLFDGPMHFGELLRQNKDLSKKVLSSNLKKLEEKGVITRKSYNDGAIVRVEYSLTKEGEKLKEILLSLSKWGERNYHGKSNESN